MRSRCFFHSRTTTGVGTQIREAVTPNGQPPQLTVLRRLFDLKLSLRGVGGRENFTGT